MGIIEGTFLFAAVFISSFAFFLYLRKRENTTTLNFIPLQKHWNKDRRNGYSPYSDGITPEPPSDE